MENLGSILNTALTVVTIATLAGLGLLRGTVTNLREQLADERASNASLRTSREEDQKEIGVLKADLSALQRVVTGEVHWIALGQQLEEHHAEARAHWTTDATTLAEIRDLLRRPLA